MTPFLWLLAALTTGMAAGIASAPDLETCVRLAIPAAGLCIVAARVAWAGHRHAAVGIAVNATLALGVALGGRAEHVAWMPPGIDVEMLESQVAAGTPLRLKGVLRRDAVLTPAGQVALDVHVTRVTVGQAPVRETSVGVRVTILGDRAPARRATWSRGREVSLVAATFRRPLPYRNFGVPHAERRLARQGLRAFATVKSDALVEVTPGPPWEEWAARVRAGIRARVGRHVRDPDRAAIVTAILIGDRSRMPADTTRDLQHAGVYHVVAISGGNVALWLAVLLLLPRAGGLGVKLATMWLVTALLAAALVVDGSPSVMRAVLVAVVGVAVRWWDVRARASQVLGVAAAVLLVQQPLGLHDPGLLLSFGAAVALVGLAAAATSPARSSLARPRLAATISVVALSTIAVEAVLLPVTLSWFSVATAAGVIANLVAVPAMSVVQVVALGLVAVADVWPLAADVAGQAAGLAVSALLRSADVVHWAPWLVRESPPPSAGWLAAYYAGGALAVTGLVHLASARSAAAGRAGALRTTRHRRAIAIAPLAGVALAATSLVVMVTGGRDHSAPAPWTWPAASGWQRASWPREPWLVVTMLDVGQGDATVVRFPSGTTWLVDAGGSVSETFDMGERVTTPALWALGHRRVDRVLVTHAHPDHANGVPAVLRRLGARELLTGVPVHGESGAQAMSDAAAAARVPERRLAAGEAFADGPVHVQVLHPERPEWERRRVRNDDSVVLWVRMGDVGLLLPGDVGSTIEQRFAHRVAAAPLTVLRLAHHGSASSTSDDLLHALRPVLAVGSMGRGNRFGHPAPVVVRRLADHGTPLLRTDRVGAVQVATNGRVLLVRTASGEWGSVSATTRHAWWPATPPPSDRATPPPATARRRPVASPPRGTGG